MPWQKMSQKTKSQLTETAQNLFHLMEQFAKLKKSQCMNILILENRVQSLLSSVEALSSYISIKTYLIQMKEVKFWIIKN